MTEPPENRGTPPEKRVPLRQFTNAPRPPNSVILAERLRSLFWFCFPIFIMFVVAAAAVLGFRYYDAKNQVPPDPEQMPLDLQASDAPTQLLNRYLKDKGGPEALGELQAEVHRFFGMVAIERERYLFESEIVRSKSATITFTSEGRTYDYEIVDGRPKLLTVSESIIPSRLERISLSLAEILGTYLDPLHAVLVEPQTYEIQQLERTRLGGLPVLAATISNLAQPTRTATAFLDERTMQTIAIKTRLSSQQTREYQFFYNGINETGFFPNEIQFRPLPDETWEILLNRGTRDGLRPQ